MRVRALGSCLSLSLRQPMVCARASALALKAKIAETGPFRGHFFR